MMKLSGSFAIISILCLLLAGAPAITLADDAVSQPTIVIIGDSLSSAYGMPMTQGWVNLLAQRLTREQTEWRVINASITGDTTHGGLSRLPDILKRQQPDVIIIELGGNDGLRGFDLQTTRENLRQMIAIAQQHSARVLLLGVRLPPNYGEAYTTLFEDTYRQLAAQEGIPLVAHFLEGIAENLDLMQADGIHPSQAAQPRMLDNIWPALLPLLTIKL